jgi:hypothetical protein
MAYLLAANLAWRERARFDLLGRPFAELVEQARSEALVKSESNSEIDAKNAGPFIVTGHQPGLVHPGVWVKNFAAAKLADEHDGVGLHVIIDADACRSPAILVPAGAIAEPRQAFVEFDAAAAELPWEERRIVDASVWESFPDRVHETCGELVTEPFLDEWWSKAVEQGAETGLVGAALAQARHETEIEWGIRNAELPQSQLCQTDAFRWFACTLLTELPRFAAAYNGALADYRRAHHLRNHAQPVPNLAAEGSRLEAPFWIWTNDDRRRRPVFAQPATSPKAPATRSR